MAVHWMLENYFDSKAAENPMLLWTVMPSNLKELCGGKDVE